MVISKPIHLTRINACVTLSSIKFRVICLAKTVFFPINFDTKPGNCPVNITQEVQCKNYEVLTSSHYFRRLQRRWHWINFSVNRLRTWLEYPKRTKIPTIQNNIHQMNQESQTQQSNHLINNNVQKYISTAWIEWKTRQNKPRNV